MNPKIQLAYNVLWSAHPVLQLSVGALMFKRKLHRKFPIFFAYIVSQVLIFSVLFPIYKWGNYREYFYAFWITSGVSLVLGFMIIHEIFLDVFHPYHTLKDLGSVLFRWAALVMLLVAGVVAASSPAGAQGPLVEAIITVQRCVRVIQCGLILFLLVFSKYLLALHASSHASEAAVNLVNLAGYNLAIATWLTYALLKSAARENAANLPLSQRWEQSLTDLQHPVPSDSLIPMFEGMVDRAFSRTNGHDRDETVVEPLASQQKRPERVPTLVARRFASKP
jgi:hypothetical protein